MSAIVTTTIIICSVNQMSTKCETEHIDPGPDRNKRSLLGFIIFGVEIVFEILAMLAGNFDTPDLLGVQPVPNKVWAPVQELKLG